MPMLLAAQFRAEDATSFILAIAILLTAAKLLGEIARAFRQPAVVGEIIAGVLLGPTLLGRVAPDLFSTVFPAEGPVADALAGFSLFAVTLLLLVVGLEIDLSTVWRQGRVALTVGIAGLIIPFAVGMGMAYLVPETLGMQPGSEALPFALFFGIAMSITALPVIARTLIDLNILKSDLGMLIVSAAMMNDFVGWMGFAVVLALIADGTNVAAMPITATLLGTLGFVTFMLSVGRWLAHRALPYIHAHTAWPGGVLGFVLAIALFCAAFTEWLGIHAIFGAFIAGVAIGDSSHMQERTRDTIHQFVTNIVAPVFFAMIGLRLDFFASFRIELVLLVLVIAIAVKVGGCTLGARWSGMSRPESLAIGFAMCARGMMEIVLAQIAYAAGLIGDDLFVAIVIMALVTSLMAGPIMKRLLNMGERRHLAQIVPERAFVPRLRARNRRAAIAELSARAAGLTTVPVRAIFQSTWRQERLAPTGLEHGVAVPHARIEGMPAPVVVIGLSDRGIDFNARDGEPARIICLILTPAEDHSHQIEILGMIASAFAKAETRSAVLASRSYIEFRAALRVAGRETPAVGA
jgi:Kef-type K+ transport system membrane component KefB/mannitol/fructose-specific phosphotransferase system IIA component (Ntr-type)